MKRMKKVAAVVAAIVISAAIFPIKASDCNDAISGLQVCFDYISGSTVAAPSTQCCSQLQGVIKTQAECLCQIAEGGGEGLKLNATRVQELPAACKVQTPPASLCNGPPPSVSGSSTKSLNTVLPHVLEFLLSLELLLIFFY